MDAAITQLSVLIEEFSINKSKELSVIDPTEFDVDNPDLQLSTNFVTKCNLLDAAITRESTLNNSGCNHVYSNEININKLNKIEPITNQRSTGTCWIYATLNMIRIPFIEKYKLKKFEFNEQYLYFWHKYEISNFFLETIINTTHLSLNSRLIQYLLSKGCEDGSQFDMALNLIEKYGLIPLMCNNNQLFAGQNEVHVKKNSKKMNMILNRKLREYSCVLRKQYLIIKNNGFQNDDIIKNKLRKLKKKQMNEIYRILVICFGKAITRFNWKYNDKDEFKCVNNISPINFYKKYVIPCYDINNLISLINDPRNEYYKLYTIEYYGNVINGKRKNVLYINVPMNIIKKYTILMIKKLNRGVWYACDVRRYYYDKFGSLDIKQFNFNKLFLIKNTSNDNDFINLTKKQNLKYNATCNAHSMLIVGFENDKNDINNIIKWKVENSWGDKKGNNGYIMMSNEWFNKYTYQIIVDKNILSKDILNVLNTQPVTLKRWDPFAQ